MLCYLNRGLILEQALVALVREYFDTLHLDNKYENFHISVTNEHPFAELYLHEGKNASDSFPAVVITSQTDGKPHEFDELAITQTDGIGITESDLEEITKTTETYIDKKGKLKTREIPGLCTVVDENTKAAIKTTIQNQGFCYGYSMRIRLKDTMSVEIWAENNQLKNEIYDQLRLFIAANLYHRMTAKYGFFDIAIFDDTITGHRSNNFNFDFDVVLCGAHISFDVNYCVEQIVLDTELTQLSKEIITEANSYGK